MIRRDSSTDNSRVLVSQSLIRKDAERRRVDRGVPVALLDQPARQSHKVLIEAAVLIVGMIDIFLRSVPPSYGVPDK
jgi:hypothetical protein